MVALQLPQSRLFMPAEVLECNQIDIVRFVRDMAVCRTDCWMSFGPWSKFVGVWMRKKVLLSSLNNCPQVRVLSLVYKTGFLTFRNYLIRLVWALHRFWRWFWWCGSGPHMSGWVPHAFFSPFVFFPPLLTPPPQPLMSLWALDSKPSPKPKTFILLFSKRNMLCDSFVSLPNI